MPVIARVWWSYLWRSTLLTWSFQGLLKGIVSNEFTTAHPLIANMLMLAVAMIASLLPFLVVLETSLYRHFMWSTEEYEINAGHHRKIHGDRYVDSSALLATNKTANENMRISARIGYDFPAAVPAEGKYE